jgi:TolB protein
MISRNNVSRIETTTRTIRAGIVAWLALFAATAANAQLNIEIRRGVERPVPIAVVPFGWQGPGSAPFDIAGLVATDLRNSGRFDPIPPSDMLARPTEPTQVNFQDWRISEVDVLVIGRLTESGPNNYTAQFQLFDVLRGQQLLGFRLTSSRDDLRATAHRIADMIFEQLTGIQGVFSTQIAYISEQRNAQGVSRYRLIVADADGENQQIIADSPQPLMSPAWSPDGRRLAYVSFEGNQSAIFVQTLRTGSRERVSAREGINGAPSFSPDGRRLALTLSRDGNLEIYTLDIATQVLRRLTDSPAIDTEPAWSPDGRSIYFTSDRAGGPQIYNVSDEGGRAQRVTFEGNYNSRPRLSPDGAQLAVVHLNQGNYRIAVVNPSSGLTQVLSNGRQDESPSYAPNGAVLIYATRENGTGVLASVSSDGRIQQRIASGEGDVREPAWSPFPRP